MLRLQPRASVLLARQRKPIGAGCPQYQCDRCPRLLSLAAGAKHKLKPSALPPDYNAEHLATRGQLPNRKLQMLLLVQRWTRESRLQRGRKTGLPLDMGLVDPDCSAYGSQVCAARRGQDRSERAYKGHGRVAAGGRPKRIDECHHLNPVASVGIEHATEQPARARR